MRLPGIKEEAHSAPVQSFDIIFLSAAGRICFWFRYFANAEWHPSIKLSFLHGTLKANISI
jgi:hypothetical protein